jgi:hypothetical protein
MSSNKHKNGRDTAFPFCNSAWLAHTALMWRSVSCGTSVDNRFRVSAIYGVRIGRNTLFLKEIWQCLSVDLAHITTVVKGDLLDV